MRTGKEAAAMAADEPLTAERVLRTAEDVLRRYGPDKTTVVDIARALGVSHAAIYRHFASKNALREAVTGRWLAEAHHTLAGLADESGPADERLHRWLCTLFEAKRRKSQGDPELFATYTSTIDRTSDIVQQHLATLTGQVATIVADGVAQDVFSCPDPQGAARAVLHATSRFHDPLHAPEWQDPRIESDLENVWTLIRTGLASRS